MSGWIKYFSDDTTEIGLDSAIKANIVSWSKGQLNNIREVKLLAGTHSCLLSVPNTKWHQFDRFIISVTEGIHKPIRTHQVIQALIEDIHLDKNIACSRGAKYSRWVAIVDDSELKEDTFLKKVNKSLIGKWITLIVPSKGLSYVVFTDKGKIE